MSSIAKKNSGVKTGGCGCKQLTGGSLASDAVIQHVDAKAWDLLDRNATNVFDSDAHLTKTSMHGGNGNGNGAVPDNVTKLATHLKQIVSHGLGMPVQSGGDSLDELIRKNLSKEALKKYKKAVKQLAEQSGGSDSAAMGALNKTRDALSGLLDASKVSSYFFKGGALNVSSLNDAADQLTAEGVRKLADLFNDATLFKSGISVASYVKNVVNEVPSKKAQVLANTMYKEHGPTVMGLVRNNLSLHNVHKFSAFLNAYKNAPMTSIGGNANANANANAKATKAKKKLEGGSTASSLPQSDTASFAYMNAIYPSFDSINRVPPANSATASQNVAMLRYNNLLDPTYSYGFETLGNPVMQLAPSDMRNTHVTASLGGSKKQAKKAAK